MSRRRQQGSFMIEALIGIVIFLMGVLAMIALQASSIAIQSDAQYRNEASNLVDQIIGDINLNARDLNGAVDAAILQGFAHNPTGGTTTCRLLATDPNANTDCCNFGGIGGPANALKTNWVNALTIDPATRLPWPTAATINQQQQIVVNTGVSNQVIVTVCWQGPKDARPRFHRVIGYVN